MQQPIPWKRCIALVDMNCFFAAIEQRDDPLLRGQPIGISNGEAGSCIITSSYEARAYGVKTGMRIKEALLLCPHFKAVSSRPTVYADTSAAIMAALLTITPLVEIFSVDEAFLELTACQALWGSPETIGKLIKRKIYEVSRLLCSVGISGDKTTAKYAAKLNKPNGLTLIHPEAARERLKNVPVTDLCGIAEGIGNFLAKYGVHTCGQMAQLPIGILAQRFGNPGRRIWYMAQGADPDTVKIEIKAPKSIGHGKVMPPNTKDKATLLVYLRHMAEKVAARLREHHFQAQRFYIGWKSYQQGWVGSKLKLLAPTQDGRCIYAIGEALFEHVWRGESYYQVQITALDPQPENSQYDLFLEPDTKRTQLNQAIDQINQRYGQFTVAPAPLLNRTKMHDVISPGFKPTGHRRSV